MVKLFNTKQKKANFGQSENISSNEIFKKPKIMPKPQVLPQNLKLEQNYVNYMNLVPATGLSINHRNHTQTVTQTAHTTLPRPNGNYFTQGKPLERRLSKEEPNEINIIN